MCAIPLLAYVYSFASFYNCIHVTEQAIPTTDLTRVVVYNDGKVGCTDTWPLLFTSLEDVILCMQVEMDRKHDFGGNNKVPVVESSK